MADAPSATPPYCRHGEPSTDHATRPDHDEVCRAQQRNPRILIDREELDLLEVCFRKRPTRIRREPWARLRPLRGRLHRDRVRRVNHLDPPIWP